MAISLGTILWLVAFVILFVFFRDDLQSKDDQWWLAVCLCGAGLGLLGVAYATRRRAVYARANRATTERGAAGD